MSNNTKKMKDLWKYRHGALGGIAVVVVGRIAVDMFGTPEKHTWWAISLLLIVVSVFLWGKKHL